MRRNHQCKIEIGQCRIAAAHVPSCFCPHDETMGEGRRRNSTPPLGVLEGRPIVTFAQCIGCKALKDQMMWILRRCFAIRVVVRFQAVALIPKADVDAPGGTKAVR